MSYTPLPLLAAVSSCCRCRGSNLVHEKDTASVVCRSCGEVNVERILCSELDVRTNDKDDSTFYSGQWRSEENKFIYGRFHTQFIGKNDEAIKKMKILQSQVESSNDGSIVKNIGLVGAFGARLGVNTHTLDKATEIFGNSFSFYHSKAAVAAAALYVACGIEGKPRTYQDVTNASGVDIRVIKKVKNIITRELKLELMPLGPEHLVPRTASFARLNMTGVEQARQFCDILKRSGMFEACSPHKIATIATIIASVYSINSGRSQGSSPANSGSPSLHGTPLTYVHFDALKEISGLSIQHIHATYDKVKNNYKEMKGGTPKQMELLRSLPAFDELWNQFSLNSSKADTGKSMVPTPTLTESNTPKLNEIGNNKRKRI